MRRIECSPAFVPGMCALGYFDPLGAFVPFLCAAAAHELGHLAAIRLCGGRVESIRLALGDAEIRTGFMSYRAELVCALAGPAANLLSFALCRGRAPAFAAMSLLLAAFNLLPARPLDGWRALGAAIRLGRHPERAEPVCRAAGLGTSLALFCAAAAAALRYKTGVWPVLAAGVLLLRLLRTSRAGKTGCFSGRSRIEWV